MAQKLTSYSTISPGQVGESLFEDRKSQFLGFAFHAESTDELVEFRHQVIQRIPEASHYVSACFLADGREFFSDAKEPHGSAGMPVFTAIKGRDLKDVGCVVARIFGGTLLGKGGLMRAYTKAASDALDAAEVVRRVPCRLMRVVVPYQSYEPLLSRLVSWGARVESADFGAEVTLDLSVPTGEADVLVERIRDFTNGRASIDSGEEELRYLGA